MAQGHKKQANLAAEALWACEASRSTLPHDLVILLLCPHPETEHTATPKPAHKCVKQHCSQQLKSKSNPNTTNGEWERHPWPAQEVAVLGRKHLHSATNLGHIIAKSKPGAQESLV